MKDDFQTRDRDHLEQLSEEFRLAEERFHNLITRSAEAMLIVGRDGRVRFANPAALGLFCLPAEELVGRDFGFPVAADSSTEIEILCHSEIRVAEMRVVESGWQGEKAYLATLRDVTERKRLEENLQEALKASERSRAEKEAVLRSVSEGMIFTDPEGRVVLMNRAAELMLGMACRAVVGTGIEGFFSDEAVQKRIRAGLQQEVSEPFDIEMPMEESSSGRILQAGITPVLDTEKRRIGAVTVLSDVTWERELSRMKSEFISTAAHELRTPLTTIVGYADLMGSGLELSREELDEFVGIIRERADTLKTMVEELLDLSRIESGQGLALDPGEYTPEECVAQVAPMVRMRGGKHRFEIGLEGGDASLRVDLGKVAQVLENLIGNAVKYSPDGGIIRVSGATGRAEYEFCVSDEGIGMTSRQVSRIFERFYRADTSNASVPGLGLGMSIVKSIVEAHGGKIEVESTPGKGTRVCFTVPLQQG